MAGNVQVTSKIKLDQAMLSKLDHIQYDILPQVADATLTELRDRQSMPFDTGNLQNDSTHLDDGHKAKGRVSVVSTTPYARRLYYHPEYNFRRNNNGSAGGKWFEPYVNGSKKDFAANAYKELFRRNGGL